MSTKRDEENNVVEVDVRFKGKAPLFLLIPKVHDIQGVKQVKIISDYSLEDDEELSDA